MTWVKLPDGDVVNTDQMQFLQVTKLTNPREQFRVVAYFSGHVHLLADNLYQHEAAQKVLEAFLQAAGIKSVTLNPDLRGFKVKVASIPPELQSELQPDE